MVLFNIEIFTNTNMSEKKTDSSQVETVAVIGFPAVSIVTAIHETDAHGWAVAPWIEQAPGIDHASSAAGSYFMGAVGGTITERIASRLESSGKPKSAERARRFGNTLTVLSSIACQLAIEGSPQGGVSDKWDVVAGIVTTAPGMIAGRYVGRIHKNDESTVNAEE